MNQIYDFAGIGIGPFNLGLAALCKPLKNFQTIFFDQKAAFSWHKNMQITGAKMQVSYLADLVTVIDPTSPFSYLKYLRETGFMFHFGVNENNYITRTEYNRYCQWVAGQLQNLLFQTTVKEIVEENGIYRIDCLNGRTNIRQSYFARRIVVGTGNSPYIPSCAKDYLSRNIIHSGDYLSYKKSILENKKIAIVGAGQSGAEIFYDLLNSVTDPHFEINWVTSDDRFYAMEYSKLVLEMSTPGYIKYFYSLSSEKKAQILQNQKTLFGGINEELIKSIYQTLFERRMDGTLPKVIIRPSCRLRKITRSVYKGYNLHFQHLQEEKAFILETEGLILATGYSKGGPAILNNPNISINKDMNGNLNLSSDYSINDSKTIFVQNADLHSHGFNAPDLSTGPYRNAIIINSILGEPFYDTNYKKMFQDFGMTG